MRSTVSAIALIAALVAAAGPALALPDLVPEIFSVSLGVGSVDPDDVVEGCAGGPTDRRLLRFSLRVRNVGATDLVLGDPRCPDCSENPGERCQNDLFHCSEAHGHPHFEGFARMELLTPTGALVGESSKVGFCLLDGECAVPQYSCAYQGISAGCADVYDSSLPCQYIDLTDATLPNGSYVLRVALDPENRLAESDDANNVVTVPIEVGPAEPPTCPVFAATDVPRPIPDLGSTTSFLTVPAGPPIARLRVVDLAGTHAYVGDLEVELRSPAGTEVGLFRRICGDVDEFHVDLADAATTILPCPPIGGGLHLPASPLAAFLGEPRGGAWELVVHDREGQDVGDLTGWGLEICGPCGNGILDPGEVCDDGNTGSGDCCSSDCQVGAADGTPCSDDDACTTADACAGGRCTGGGATVCDPCLACYPAVGCAPPLTTVCQAAPARGSRLTLRRAGGGTRDALAWQWKSQTTVLPGDFGTPASSTDMRLCLFDQSGLRWSGEAPAGGLCRGRACWKATKSIVYRDPDLTPDGIAQLALTPGSGGRARIATRGKSANLGLPALDLSLPATFRLKRADGSPICWDARYRSATRRTPDLFQARTD
jgi:cysteine-rich repeat protein